MLQLISDEHTEQRKRLSAMDKRLQDLKKERGILQRELSCLASIDEQDTSLQDTTLTCSRVLAALTSKRVEELYESLSRKNAQIYVQRSRQLYDATPMRTRLFTWELKRIEIVALADPSVHGKENVVKNMRQIDPDRYV